MGVEMGGMCVAMEENSLGKYVSLALRSMPSQARNFLARKNRNLIFAEFTPRSRTGTARGQPPRSSTHGSRSKALALEARVQVLSTLLNLVLVLCYSFSTGTLLIAPPHQQEQQEHATTAS